MSSLKARIEELAERAGAIDPDASVTVRADRLRQELARAQLADRTEVVERAVAGERRVVVFYRENDHWSEHTVPIRDAGRDDRTEADGLRDFEDATIQGAADLLEAKYRADQFRKEYLRGTPLDPTLFHDTVDLAMRTWRESVTLSIRAQRSLTGALRDLVPKAPKRPAPRIWTEAPVRLRPAGTAGIVEGRFVIRNNRSSFLRCELHGRVVGPDDGPVVGMTLTFSPDSLRLAPDARQHVTVMLASSTAPNPGWSGRIEWSGDECPLAPVPLDFPK